MNFPTICTVLAVAILTIGVPVGPPSAWTLSVESSASSASSHDVTIEAQNLPEFPSFASNDVTTDSQDLPELPGFSSMLSPENSTSVSKYAITDTSSGLLLDGGICKNVSISGDGKVGETSLQAKCVDNEGIWWDTTLNLNRCAANAQGLLVFHSEGNFDESCRPCVVVDPIDVEGLQLKCKCVNGQREEQYAMLPLGSQVDHPLAVKPVNGRLTCGNIRGIQTPSFYGY